MIDIRRQWLLQLNFIEKGSWIKTVSNVCFKTGPSSYIFKREKAFSMRTVINDSELTGCNIRLIWTHVP